MNVKRNDPCPCGSGKKYKKCCGKIELESKRFQRSFSAAPAGENTLVSFANRIIKVMEAKEEFVPPAHIPESHASTKEAETPELSPPRKITPGPK